MIYEKSVEFWDGESEINGRSKDVILKSYPWAAKEKALLVFEDTLDYTQRVERVGVMKRVLGLPKDSTDEEVRKALYDDVNKEYFEQEAAKKESGEESEPTE